MLYIAGRSNSDLPTIFRLDDTESSIFRCHEKLRASAGSWAKFLDFLPKISSTFSGSICGISWEMGKGICELWSDRVYINAYSSKRLYYWLKVSMGDQQLHISLEPEIYNADNPYVDQKFEVKGDNKIVPILMLFADQILTSTVENILVDS